MPSALSLVISLADKRFVSSLSSSHYFVGGCVCISLEAGMLASLQTGLQSLRKSTLYLSSPKAGNKVVIQAQSCHINAVV